MSSNFCGPHAISTVLPAPVLRNGSMSSARQAAELHKGTRPPRGQRIHCSPAFPLQAFLSTQQCPTIAVMNLVCLSLLLMKTLTALLFVSRIAAGQNEVTPPAANPERHEFVISNFRAESGV